MPDLRSIAIESLSLDPRNYRTVKQASEEKELHALITIDPDYFWGIADSLLVNNYVATENVLVGEPPAGSSIYIVREGNRRVGALKLAHGLLDRGDIEIPEKIEEKLATVTPEWKARNATVPCLAYSPSESKELSRVVSLIHGPRQYASRLPWNPVAKARQNRDELENSEPVLDFLEAYLRRGKNLNSIEKERWTGDYPLTILEEALYAIKDRLGFETLSKLVEGYPALKKFRSGVEKMAHDIGIKSLSFADIRDEQYDFAVVRYGLPERTKKAGEKNQSGTKAGAAAKSSKGNSGNPARKVRSAAVEDARSVRRELRNFHPLGRNRAKLTTLVGEARLLTLRDHKYAFCFVLRSMFEISVKAYSKDHLSANIKLMDGNKERPLKKLLGEVVNHLTQNGANKEIAKAVGPALSELGKKDGILSVESLNQLVHNPSHTITEPEICSTFHKVFPLLQAMNR